VVAAAVVSMPGTAAALPGFPGAQGFGGGVTGGRGGAVIKVTTLAESGPGSLREAHETPGPRMIVFAVSGVIDLEDPNPDDVFDEGDTSNVLVITEGDVTIAGESAPGAGITIRGRLYAAYDEGVGNIIVRHIRVRPPAWNGSESDGEQYDALRFSLNPEVLVDHVSVSGGVDENVDAYEAADITVQWSAIVEAALEGHVEGEHNYGLLNYGGRVTVHHTLFAHNKNRDPALALGPAESINNTAYNVRHGFVNHNEASGEMMLVGNTFIQGPDDSLIPFFFDGGEEASYWLADNAVDDPGEFVGVIDDPWSEPYFADVIGASTAVRADAPFQFGGGLYEAVAADGSAEAHAQVLACAGAFPRDVVDARVIAEVEARGGSWGAKYPQDLMAGLTAEAAPVDADDDGMADDWELQHGLDPADGGDHAAIQPSGYTAIETYLHGLAEALACGTPPVEETTGDESSGTSGATSGATSGEPGTGGETGAGPTSGPGPGTGSGAATSGVSDGTGGTGGETADAPTDGSDLSGSGSSVPPADGGGEEAGGCACRSERGAGLWALLAAPWLRRRRR
jgi:pectate lyase